MCTLIDRRWPTRNYNNPMLVRAVLFCLINVGPEENYTFGIGPTMEMKRREEHLMQSNVKAIVRSS